MMQPAIVISAYNRPAALTRLLASIDRGHYPDAHQIPLVISIDQAGAFPKVVEAARSFPWDHGPKEILLHPDRLGPLDHFYLCGDLSEKYHAIVFLEDDLIVSPYFESFAGQALSYYASDPCLAGISLYSLWFNGYTLQPFIPLADGTDLFFLQVPYTQGLAFTGEMWAGFREWRSQLNRKPQEMRLPIHEAWSRFQPDEWFPAYTRYLVSAGKYFAYPRLSLSSGSGDAGTHFASSTGFFQVPLERAARNYQFKPLAEAVPVYDSFFELLPDRMDRLTLAFRGYDYTVDLNATRTARNIPTPYVLTTRPCSRPLLSYGREMRPMEANLEYSVTGEGINFCRVDDLTWGWLAEIQIRKDRERYFSRGRRLGAKQFMEFLLLDLYQKIGGHHAPHLPNSH